METIRKEAGFDGDLEQFFDHLRSDPKFFFREKSELLVAYRDIAKRLDPELPRLFRTLPRLPYGVAGVPEYSEKTQPTAYYMPGSPEAGRPGIFYANTYDLPSRPRWEMEALTAHEAVPGHHLQIALAQEMENVPEFRKWASYTAFIEGWGLYFGVSRRRAGAVSRSLLPLRPAHLRDVARDPAGRGYRHSREGVDPRAGDRVLPGARRQSGSRHLRRGRSLHRLAGAGARLQDRGAQDQRAARAGRERMGSSFDIRAFHDAVLLAGPIPLSLLEKRVEEWISRAGAAGPTLSRSR